MHYIYLFLIGHYSNLVSVYREFCSFHCYYLETIKRFSQNSKSICSRISKRGNVSLVEHIQVMKMTTAKNKKIYLNQVAIVTGLYRKYELELFVYNGNI